MVPLQNQILFTETLACDADYSAFKDLSSVNPYAPLFPPILCAHWPHNKQYLTLFFLQVFWCCSKNIKGYLVSESLCGVWQNTTKFASFKSQKVVLQYFSDMKVLIYVPISYKSWMPLPACNVLQQFHCNPAPAARPSTAAS